VTFIGLNPSDADETKDDPTIRRIIGFAKSWGYGGAYVVNLFDQISSDPKTVAIHLAGELNEEILLQYTLKSELVILAWGSDKIAEARALQVLHLLPAHHIPAFCLGINKNGSPKHPLYVRGDSRPSAYY